MRVWKPSQPYGIGDPEGCRLASSLTFKMHRRQLLGFSAGIRRLKCGKGTKKWLITTWNGSRKRQTDPAAAASPFHSVICIAAVGLFGSRHFGTVVCFAPWESKKVVFAYSHTGTDKALFLKINITYEVFKIFLSEHLRSSQIFVWRLWQSECAKFMLAFTSLISTTGIFKSNLVKFSSCRDCASVLEEH